MTAAIHKPISQLKITWPLLPDDFILPDDPVDDIEHPLIASGLRQSVAADSQLMQDALAVTNFALCGAIDDRTICKAPDWMYVKPVQPWPHSYPVWGFANSPIVHSSTQSKIRNYQCVLH